MKLNIVRPSHPKVASFSADLATCLESGVVTNDGPWVRKFERALSDYLGTPTIVFNNGQSALMAMLAACDVRGGEVICPSFTFCATPHAIEWAGARPMFADIEERTLCLDPNRVHSRIGSRTKAILGVDPYGIAWKGMSTPKYVLCDSAPSFGTISGRIALDAQIFSFHATKPFSTMEGGALSSYNFELLDRAARIRNFGQDAHGDCEFPGFNGKMMEICAMIGLRQLEAWQDVCDHRRAISVIFEQELAGIKGLTIVKAPQGQSPIWLYRPVLIDEREFGMSRDAVVGGLKSRDINVRKYYGACHRMTCYKDMGFDLPVTDRIASQVISLPVYNDMTVKEVVFIAKSLREIRGN